jgi:hypothetical protein
LHPLESAAFPRRTPKPVIAGPTKREVTGSLRFTQLAAVQSRGFEHRDMSAGSPNGNYGICRWRSDPRIESLHLDPREFDHLGHFSVSSTTNFPNSAGAIVIGSAPFADAADFGPVGDLFSWIDSVTKKAAQLTQVGGPPRRAVTIR